MDEMYDGEMKKKVGWKDDIWLVNDSPVLNKCNNTDSLCRFDVSVTLYLCRKCYCQCCPTDDLAEMLAIC